MKTPPFPLTGFTYCNIQANLLPYICLSQYFILSMHSILSGITCTTIPTVTCYNDKTDLCVPDFSGLISSTSHTGDEIPGLRQCSAQDPGLWQCSGHSQVILPGLTMTRHGLPFTSISCWLDGIANRLGPKRLAQLRDSAYFIMLFFNEKFAILWYNIILQTFLWYHNIIILPEIYLDIEDKEEWKWYQPIYGQIHVGKVHLQQNISQLRT